MYQEAEAYIFRQAKCYKNNVNEKEKLEKVLKQQNQIALHRTIPKQYKPSQLTTVKKNNNLAT